MHADLQTVVISDEMGLGGLLNNAADALHLGGLRGVDIALKFTSDLYAPRGRRGEDWLDEYFLRLGPAPDAGASCNARFLPKVHEGRVGAAESSDRLWSAIRIRPEIEKTARIYAPSGRYIGVHYRGGDKSLEVGRVDYNKVLDAVEVELSRADRDLFVASDEVAFVDQAKRRFGQLVHTMPISARSDDKVSAHFQSNVDGKLKAIEALQTMVLLSNADSLVKTESLLSDWASTMSGSQEVTVIGAASVRTG